MIGKLRYSQIRAARPSPQPSPLSTGEREWRVDIFDHPWWQRKRNDTLEGGPGQDHLFGQGGNDLLLPRDVTHDSLNGGDGFDTAMIDDTAAFKDQVLNVEAFV